jgi:hypothetical protein
LVNQDVLALRKRVADSRRICAHSRTLVARSVAIQAWVEPLRDEIRTRALAAYASVREQARDLIHEARNLRLVSQMLRERAAKVRARIVAPQKNPDRAAIRTKPVQEHC